MAVDFMKYLDQDKLYLQAFCGKYDARVVSIVSNTEDSPPRGLIYVFDNQLGGFSIEGIINSLEEKVEQISGQR